MKTEGMKHQLRYLDVSEGKRNFAIFGEQGTGKTWMALADAERCFIGNKIDAILIFAPKGVHTNWVRREIPKHLGVPSVCFAWSGPVKTKKQKDGMARLYTPADRFDKPTLRVFTINFEAMLRPDGIEAVAEFIRCFRVMAMVDESKKIGNPDAKRTKNIIKAGRPAEARRILSGKPLTKAPMDLFSQFDFLKEGLLGTKSYRAFVAEYAVLLDPRSPKMQGLIRKMGPKAAFAQIVETDEEGNKMYKNLDKLAAMLQPHMYRIRKDECLDLPPKVYHQKYFSLTDEQRRVYDKLKSDHEFVSCAEGHLSFQAIAARTKMKQVTSGFLNVYGQPELVDGGANPRMDLFLDIVDDLEGQFIVWAIYREEIAQIVKALEEQGISCVQYHGGVKEKEREQAIDDFQAGKFRAFVCNKAAYAGITLTAAKTSIYYSCDFDNDVRSQSEDRNHRIGTVGDHVLYVDLIAEDTIDEDVVKNLAIKDAIADHVIDGRPLTV
jgi:SNF2 family DNA or RNA helicase